MNIGKNKLIWIAAGIAVLAILIFYPRQKSTVSTAAPAASGPALAWKFTNDRTTFANVTLAPDGTIYAGSNQGVFAISPAGKMKWYAQYGGISYATLGTDGVLYAAEMHGMIFGISPDGNVNWKPGYGLIGFHAPPAIGPGVVLFANTTSDLYAFEPGATQLAWSQSTSRPGVLSGNSSLPGSAEVGMSSASAPVVYSDDSIALSRQHWMTMFSRDGSPFWSLELTPRQLGQAALAEDGTIYAGDEKTLYAVSTMGILDWKYDAPDGCCIGSPVVDADGTIYFSSAASVTALDRNGRLKWNVKLRHGIQTSPTLAADGSIYLGANDGLLALNSDGTEKWLAKTPTANSAPAIATDGTVYFACGYIWICAVQGTSSPLMKSPWPRIYHDSANTGNILTSF
jgi:putative pyrroloquinoline-quinone binding quinoprotein